MEAALVQLRPDFPELRGVSSDTMMYIKEDLVMPLNATFHEFIVSKARGKSGPLFNFGEFEDVRMLHDATIEKNESHAGKVWWHIHLCLTTAFVGRPQELVQSKQAYFPCKPLGAL